MVRLMPAKLFGAFIAASIGVLVAVAPAGAAGGYSLFGDATLVSGHNSPTGVQLRSSAIVAPGYGGIDFAVPAGMTFAQLQTLATDYMFTENSCGGGAPRFQVNIDGVNAQVYLGPAPNYTNCPQGSWQTTGNLVGSGFVDTSQLPGGTFYDTWAHAEAAYGSDVVTGIQLVVDGDWFFNFANQTAIVDNVNINGTIYTFESAASCKGDGWQSFVSAPGPFKNQGDCVSFFATGGRNTAG